MIRPNKRGKTSENNENMLVAKAKADLRRCKQKPERIANMLKCILVT